MGDLAPGSASSLNFLELKHLGKFHNPKTTPSRKKVTERQEEKHAINSGHYVFPATPKGSARTSLGPKCTYFCEHGLPMLGDHGGLVAVEGDRGLVEGLFGMP
jgi:hypothetical protein